MAPAPADDFGVVASSPRTCKGMEASAAMPSQIQTLEREAICGNASLHAHQRQSVSWRFTEVGKLEASLGTRRPVCRIAAGIILTKLPCTRRSSAAKEAGGSFQYWSITLRVVTSGALFDVA